MMDTTSARTETLVSPHCVRYASFRARDLDEQRQVLERWSALADGWQWDGRPAEVATDADLFPRARPDTFMALHQARLDGPCTPEEAARFCLEFDGAFPWPKGLGPLMSRTTVVLARVESPAAERADEARALLTGLTGGRPVTVVGGPIGPGVSLWSALDDATWLVLLCDDEQPAEDAAARRLYGALWMAETCAHKIRYQADVVGSTALRLKDALQPLRACLDRLTEVLEVPLHIDPDAEALTEAIGRHAATTRARRAVTEEIGNLRMLATSIEANRANLLYYRKMLGDPAGCVALDIRLRDADRGLDQIRTELGESEPIEQIADDTAALHQSRLMTSIALTEMAETRQRQLEADRRDDGIFKLTLLGLWIGLSQTFAAFISVIRAAPDGDPLLPLKTFAAATLIMGASFLAWWKLRRNRRTSAKARS